MLIAVITWLASITNVVSLFHRLNKNYNIELNKCRKFEKLNRKVLKLQCDINFLQKCLEHDLVPKYLSLKDKNQLLNLEIIKQRQNRAMSKQIRQHKTKLKHLRLKMSTNFQQIQSVLSMFDRLLLIKFFTRENTKFVKRTMAIHQKKFMNLFMMNKMCTPDGTVQNFSSVQLTDEQTYVLKTGLKHPTFPSNNNCLDLLCKLEKVVYSMKDKVTKTNLNDLKVAYHNYSKRLQNLLKTPVAKHNSAIIKSLKSNSDIRIVPFDKGNGIAILDTNDYINKLETIVKDKTKFTPIMYSENNFLLDHPVVKQQNKIKYFLNKYVKPHVDPNTLKFITPTGSNSGKMYGSAKVHKQGNPLRPIVASFGTAEYNLAKYLNKFIVPVIPNTFSVENNTDLLDRLNNYKFTTTSKLVSFDVESLFTNVPLQEVIELAATKVYDSNITKPPFDKDTFKKLLQFATGGIFSFNNTLYKQCDGLSMGSPLAPTLSNLFMGHLETNFLNNDKKNLKFYVRYVDDILAIFENDNHETFFNYINSWHQNIKFTTEIGDKTIPFLDINLDITNNVLETSVYRKPTYTGLILNFKAHCPLQWKRGLLATLINRAYNVCSTWKNFHNELDKLIDIFKDNGYPLCFIQNCIKSYLDNKFNPKSKEDTKYDLTIKVPFFGIQSVYFKKRLQSIIKRLDNTVNIRWVFTCNKTKNYFSNKDKTPHLLKSCVVYQFSCEVDPRTTYIGRTLRHMNLRLKEHKNNMSAISDHRLNCSCSCKPENFKILSQAQDSFELNIQEAIFIKKFNPNLNKQINHDGASFSCKLI